MLRSLNVRPLRPTFRQAEALNETAESIAKTNTWREPFTRGRRCLIPIDGFYEWKVLGTDHLEKGKLLKNAPKQPYIFTVSDGRPFALAGLWGDGTTKQMTHGFRASPSSQQRRTR